MTVVVGSAAPREALEACLTALEPQRGLAEVLVCEARESPSELRERFSWASFHVAEGALVVVAGRAERARLERPRGCKEIEELLAPWLR